MEEEEEEKKGEKEDLEVDAGSNNLNEKGINVKWIDREEWRRKIKFLTQKDAKTLILYILLLL